MLHLLHNAVCWLLSAVLLLTNGLPLAFQHAHEVGGDVAHHSHRFDRLLGEIAAPAVCDADGIMAGVTEHVHLLWFGWELTFAPAKGGKPVSTPSLSGGGLLAKVDVRAGVTRDGVCAWIAIVSPRVLDVAEWSGRARQISPPRNLASLPLCDTARHLRSGVQLI